MPTYNTRIQLKSDTEANWQSVEATFRPLPGELIIYSADNTHSYCRAKIGTPARDTLRDLPFIDAGTVNGNEVEIVKLNSFEDRPSPGSPDKLYIDTSTNIIYHYDNASGYTQLSNFSLSVSQTAATQISGWSTGILTQATIEDNILKITNGSLPSLNYTNVQVLNGVSTTSSQG